jgi:hypothetical protein
LFNSGCGSCSGIAGQIEEETGGFLVTRSLAELEIQHLLNEALPDWKWEPLLMEVSDTKDVRVYTGVYMRLRLIQLLGISKAARVASIVYQSLQPLVPVQERRIFLRYSGGLLAGLAVLGLKPMRATAQIILENSDSGSTISGRHLSGSELQTADRRDVRLDLRDEAEGMLAVFQGTGVRFLFLLASCPWSLILTQRSAEMAEASNSKKLMIIIALVVGGILADYFDPEIEFAFLEVVGGIVIIAVTIWFWPTTKVGRYITTFYVLLLLAIGLAIIGSDLFGELPTWVFVALFAAVIALTPFLPFRYLPKKITPKWFH